MSDTISHDWPHPTVHERRSLGTVPVPRGWWADRVLARSGKLERVMANWGREETNQQS